jgi:hypothetical protein
MLTLSDAAPGFQPVAHRRDRNSAQPESLWELAAAALFGITDLFLHLAGGYIHPAFRLEPGTATGFAGGDFDFAPSLLGRAFDAIMSAVFDECHGSNE